MVRTEVHDGIVQPRGIDCVGLCHAGDFNCDVSSEPGRLVFSRLRDSYRAHTSATASTGSTSAASSEHEFPEGTFTNFTATPTFPARIDWIGVSAAWIISDAFIDRTLKPDGRTPSDHFAVGAVLSRC
jgi:endonuclease/exonuclease/phosphatase family metal-dependent hydrolase